MKARPLRKRGEFLIPIGFVRVTSGKVKSGDKVHYVDKDNKISKTSCWKYANGIIGWTIYKSGFAQNSSSSSKYLIARPI